MSDQANFLSASDNGCAENFEGDAQDGNGDWCTISRKKTKKTAGDSVPKSGTNTSSKKKKTLSLQQFFSESASSTANGSQQSSRIGSRQRSASSSSSEEASVLMASLHTLFSDNLRRMGPVRLDDPRLSQIISSCSDEARMMVAQQFPSLPAFLANCPELQLVDNFVCLRSDVKNAVAMATEAVHVAMMAQAQQRQFAPLIRSDSASPSLTASTASAASTPPPPVASTHWPMRSTESSSCPSTSTSSSLSQHSLDGSSPDLAHPTPIERPRHPSSLAVGASSATSSGFGGLATVSSVVPQLSGFGGIGTAVREEANLRATIDALSKRVEGLTKSNSELLAKLQEQDKEIEHLNRIIASREESLAEQNQVQHQVKNVQQEVSKLKLANGLESMRDSDLILFLQQKLENEKLNSQNLGRQLELERRQSDLICPPSTSLQPQPIGSPASPRLSGLPAINRAIPPPVTNPFSLRSLPFAGDALGLRGILELASSSSLPNGSAAPGSPARMTAPPPGLPTSAPPLPLMSCPPPLPASATAASNAAASNAAAAFYISPSKAPSEQQRIFDSLLLHFPGMAQAELHCRLQKLRSVHGRLSGQPLLAIVQKIKDQIDRPNGITHTS